MARSDIMNYLWLASLESTQVAMNLSLYKELQRPNIINIHFGALKKNFNVIIKNDLLIKTIGLPINFIDKYTIPTNIPYEIYHKDGKIYLGPVIAHVVMGRFDNLNKKELAEHLPRFSEYESIKGLIYICTKDSINVMQDLIKGYYYDPKGLVSGSVWRYGEFPLPNAIFNRSLLSQKTIKPLQKRIGIKIFNSYFHNLNKWNIWRNLSQDKELIQHLPYTEKYTGVKQLRRLLNKYQSVYLKPYSKSRGRGILNVSKKPSDKNFLVIDEKKQRYYFQNYKSVGNFLKKKLLKPSIIQQPVPFKIGNKQLDFRIILQRDKDKGWSYKGCAAKISQEGSVITNRKSREKVIEGKEALTTIYNLSEEAAVKMEKEMFNLTKKAIYIYEKTGMHLGDVGADIILDSDLHLWLLELQLNHGTTEEFPKSYKEIMATPFRYAKALAGFIND